MHRPTVLITTRSIHLLALCFWLGGLAVTGAVVAPVAFGALDRADAGRVVGECFRRLNWAGIVCGALMLATAIADRRPGSPRSTAVGFGAILAAVMLCLYLSFSLFPQMDALREGGGRPSAANAAAFDRLHKRYERLGSVQVLLLLVALVGVAGRGPDR